MVDNRRTSARHSVSLSATLALGDASADCTISNLSLGGALIATSATSTRHRMGERVQLTFAVPTGAEPIEIAATVRWADAESVGIQFDGLRARDVWALNEFFKKLVG